MKVYIVTESRTATDLFDREDDYTKILGVFAKKGYDEFGAAYLIDTRIGEITAEWADMETYETEVSRPHGEDGDAEPHPEPWRPWNPAASLRHVHPLRGAPLTLVPEV